MILDVSSENTNSQLPSESNLLPSSISTEVCTNSNKSEEESALFEPCSKKPKTASSDDEQNTPTDDKNDHSDDIPSTNSKLSKRQVKKMQKLAKWTEIRKVKRLKEREKYRQKRIEAIANGEPTHIGPSRKALKHNTMIKSTNPFTVAIDLDFDELMIDKDIGKLAKQLLWVYTYNRKADSPLQLHYTGLKEKSRLRESLERNDGYRNWDVHFHEQSYMDVFPKDNIVYLTSDSDDILTEMDKNDVYIIGGLVDHNHHKGLALRRAEEKGLRTARLPLSEHILIKTRTVLTITHGMCAVRIKYTKNELFFLIFYIQFSF